MYDLVNQTLERCAERCEDLTDPVYARYFATDAAAAELMGHSDEHMRGRMLAQTLELFMSDEHLGEGQYLRWEVNNHLLAYGVVPSMYQNFLDAIKWVVKDILSDSWSTADEDAWRALLDDMVTEIMAQARELGV